MWTSAVGLAKEFAITGRITALVGWIVGRASILAGNDKIEASAGLAGSPWI